MNKTKLNKIKKFLVKHWITVWLMIASILLVSVITAFAAYTDANNRFKRVLVASKQISSLFTSNYLVSGSNHRSVYFNDGEETSFSVLLRNYDPSDPTQIYDGSITYSLHAELAHTSCNAYTSADLALSEWNNNNMSIVISKGTDIITLSGETLSGDISSIVLSNTDGYGNTNVRNINEWNITFDNIPLNSDYCVTLTATPTDGTGPITATIGIANYPDTDHDGWTCSIADNRALPIGNYDAFNYIISGSGATTLKFSYDASKLTLNPIFTSYNSGAVLNDTYQGSGNSASHSGWKTLVITVNNDNVSRYDIQMYKSGTTSPSNWNLLDPENNNWVEFEFVPPSV